jgi:hypothetical protein
MIRINVWFPDLEKVGHSSAIIGCESEPCSAYVSWWPSGDGSILKPNIGAGSSEAADIAAEGGPPHATREINGLREDEAAKWWNEFLEGRMAYYDLILQNCCWAVVSALKAGGADQFFPWYKIFHKYNFNTVKTPDTDTFFQYLKSAFKLSQQNNDHPRKDRWTFALKRPMVDLFDETSYAWSPRDVLTYCDHLLAGINRTALPNIGKR